MPLYNNNLLFIHIPKTAGSYLEKKLSKYETNSNNYGYDCKKEIYKQHYTYNNYLEKYGIKNMNNFKIFCVIRNPYDRLFSAYKQIFKKTSDKNLIIMMKSENFRDFVLNKLEKLIKNSDKHKYKGNITHILPQTNFIKNKNDNVKIIKYENLENISDYLKLCDINESIKFSNTHSTYTTNYDESMKRKMQEVYKNDFILYQNLE